MVASTFAKTTKPTGKFHHPTHPSWVAMITECIVTIPDGARHGVSRPAIKKFVDSKYHLPMNTAATGQLNRAITHGTHNGNFVQPKGPSGKVKLAPQSVAEIAKENKKPPSRRPVAPKPTTKTETPLFAEEHHLTATPATRKYRSMAKKARVHVTPVPGRRVPARNATKKRGTKPAVTGSSRKTRSATKRVAEARK